MPIQFGGTKAPSRADREALTTSSKLQFATKVGDFVAPGLVINRRTFLDKSPEDQALDETGLGQLTTSEELLKAVEQKWESHKDYFLASDVTENPNERLGVSGLRIGNFVEAIRNQLNSTGLSSKEKKLAKAALNRFEARAFMNRPITFDVGDLDGYRPYRDPYRQGVEAIRNLTNAGLQRDQLESVLRYIVDRKTTKSGSSIDETNLEYTLGLRPIDRDNNDQSLSLADGSDNVYRPKYVVINVQDDVPQEHKEHARKAVVKDGDRYLFDLTGEVVPEAIVKDYLQVKNASSNTGLRLLEAGETTRRGIPYDWNRSGSINRHKINTGWWGHCHLEAALAVLSLSAGSNVTMLNAETGAKEVLGEREINDQLFMLLDCDDYRSARTGSPGSPREGVFVGNRNDTTNGARPGDELLVQTDRHERSFNLQLSGLFDAQQPDKRLDIAEHFQPTILNAEDGLKFKKNPAYRGARKNDWSKIDGERKWTAVVEYDDVQNGEYKLRRETVTYDPNDPDAGPVLIGTDLDTSEVPYKVTKFYLNPQNRELERVDTDGNTKSLGKISSLTLSRELTKESIIQIHNYMLEAAKKGWSFVTEKDSGQSVWNYGTKGLTLEEVEHEGNYTKYRARVDTQGGPKTWEYILKHDAAGNPTDAHAIGTPPDFLWTTIKRVLAPVYESNGQLYYNSAARDRGHLLDETGRNISRESLAVWEYASDVLYASLRDPQKQNVFVVKNGDDLYFYDNEEAFAADEKRIKESLDSGGDNSVSDVA